MAATIARLPASRRAANAVGFGGRHRPASGQTRQPAPPAPPPRPRMRLTSFKLVKRGALVGFASVRLPNSLLITGCTVWQSNGKIWASLPERPVIGADGRQVEIDGIRQYARVAAWPDRETNNRFSTALVELVRERHPEIFSNEEGAG